MQLEITENDYKDYLGEDRYAVEFEKQGVEILNEEDDKIDKVWRYLTSVVLHKLKKHVPSDYGISKVSVKLKIGGSPLGVGVDGELTVDLEKES